MQRRHCDRAHEGSLRGEPSLARVPITVIWAVERDTRLIVEGVEYDIQIGDFAIFRGDVCHQGSAYGDVHTRIHMYLDPIDLSTDAYIHGCNAG